MTSTPAPDLADERAQPMTWDDLRSRYLLAGHLRQERLAATLGEHRWTLDLASGTATLGAHHTRVNILGNDSPTLGWRWGWAMESDGVPADLAVAAAKARLVGERHGIAELTTADVPAGAVDSFELALVAAGIAGPAGLYRGPHPGGSLFFTVDDITLAPLDLATLPRVLTEVIESYAVDHRTAVGYAATDCGFTWRAAEPDTTRRVAERGADSFTVEFDDLGRLSKLSATLGGY